MKNYRRTPAQSEAYLENRARRWELAGGRCEADGLHHRDCPGVLAETAVTHHVLPRAKGGSDGVENLRVVWNGLTSLGAGGCHGRIHGNPTAALELGLLAKQS